jgi:predicted  nucleic acid-binding Zn-ribbon protein
MERIQGRVKETLEAVTQQLQAQAKEAAEAAEAAAAGVNQRITAAEQNVDDIRKHFATLQSNVAADLHDFESTLKSQGTAIESARTAMAQTDDLVERVVEALELLQTSMIDHEPAGVN